MTAPVRDSIELNAVGELHLICLVKLTDLLCPFGFSPKTVCLFLLTLFYVSIIGEFVFPKVRKFVSARCPTIPFLCQPCRCAVHGVNGSWWAARFRCRGGRNDWCWWGYCEDCRRMRDKIGDNMWWIKALVVDGGVASKHPAQMWALPKMGKIWFAFRGSAFKPGQVRRLYIQSNLAARCRPMQGTNRNMTCSLLSDSRCSGFLDTIFLSRE